MADIPSEQDYLHFQWTMPGGIPGGPAEPLPFSIIAAEMKLSEAPVFIEGLQGVIDDRNLAILRQAVKNLLADPRHGSKQDHVFVFVSAETSDLVVIQAGSMVLFGLLEKRWPQKTISLIPLQYDLFQKIQAVATQHGLWPSAPPSEN